MPAGKPQAHCGDGVNDIYMAVVCWWLLGYVPVRVIGQQDDLVLVICRMMNMQLYI